MFPRNEGNSFRIIAAMNINIANVPPNSLWKMKAAIGYDFLSGGSLG